MNEHILIVDDERELAELVSLYLTLSLIHI